MAYGLGSARANKWAMALYAAIAVVWSGWKAWQYHSSDDVLAKFEPLPGIPAAELFGGQLQAGNSVELSVPKADLMRLMGLIDFMRYGSIVVGMVIILVGLLFVYRFCDRVIVGNPFTNSARTDVVMIGVCIALYPAITGFMNVLATNSVVGVLELSDTVETSTSTAGLYTATVVAVFLQFVYATITQGTKLARDTEGLV
ncbi:hypothetical protein ACIGGF_06890 [Rhodococcus sp. NPDC078407]|uniref:hypothetical protein n=1 Tax=Rhodococcus sp. NPDC078407 TaxID=3364509 RepID=UPI0037C8FFBD